MIVYDQPTRKFAGKRLVIADEHREYYDRNHGTPERGLIEWVREWYPSGTTFLDVGAHVGAWTIGLAEVAARVIAFEPKRTTFYQLCGALVLNDVADKAYAANVALGAETTLGTRLEHASGDGSGSRIGQRRPGMPLATGWERVDTFALDAWMKERGPYVEEARLASPPLGRIGLIKIDVEGSELAVLRGAERTIREHDYPKLVFESWNPDRFGDGQTWADDARRDLFTYLRSLGYDVQPVLSVDEMYIAERKKP